MEINASIANRSAIQSQMRKIDADLRTDGKTNAPDNAQKGKAAESTKVSDAGLYQLVAAQHPNGVVNAQTGGVSIDLQGKGVVQLAAPKVSAYAPQAATDLVNGLKHEQDNLSQALQNPNVSMAVGTLVQQFSVPPKGDDAQKAPSAQDNQIQLSEGPGASMAVGTLMQQFSVPPKGSDAKQATESADRAANIQAAGIQGSSSHAAFFGSGSAERAFSVVLQMTQSLQNARQAEAQLQGTMLKAQHQATVASANAMQEQGQAMMTGAISGGVLQGSMAALGGAQQLRGLNTRANSIQSELKPKAELKLFDRQQSNLLRGMDKPVMPEGEISHLNTIGANGEGRRFALDSSNDRLSNEHAQVLSQERPERQHRMEMHDINHESNSISADRMRTTGGLIDTAGAIAKSQAEGVAGMQQQNARAEGALAENAQQVAGATADAHRERAQAMQDLNQKMQQTAMDIANAQSGVASQVASNLRS